MVIWNFFRKEERVEDMDFLQKGRKSQRCGISSERRNKSKIWTFLEKEDKVDIMNPPWKYGSSQKMGSDDETAIDDGMTVMLQH